MAPPPTKPIPWWKGERLDPKRWGELNCSTSTKKLGNFIVDCLVNVYVTIWKDPPIFMGNSWKIHYFYGHVQWLC